MTPLLAVRFGTTTAVALVTLPHAAATAVRCWRLRAHVDRTVLVRFGLLSAAGALAGALDLHPTRPRRSHARPRRSPAPDRRCAAHGLGVSLATAWTGCRAIWPRVWLLWRHRRQSRRSALGRLDGFWPSTAWIRRDRDGNRSPGRCGANTGLPLALGASTAHALGTHHRRHCRSPHRDHRGRADVAGIVAAPFRPDNRRGNRRTRDLDARDAGLTAPLQLVTVKSARDTGATNQLNVCTTGDAAVNPLGKPVTLTEYGEPGTSALVPGK